MTTPKRNLWTDVRVVWAIFAKDMREVIRNRNIFPIVISALSIAVIYRFLPSLSRGSEPIRVWVYDQGRSGLAQLLESSSAIDAWAGAESMEKVEELLRESDLPEIGLVIPADFDQRLEAGQEVALQGYLMSWVDREDGFELEQTVEGEIARLLGRGVPIQTEGNLIDLLPDSTGPGLQASMATVFLLTLIGVSVVPHLMMAEKQEHTLDVLLTSPASGTHVVLSKALTGLVYCLLGGAIALALNHNIVVHWWLAILGLVCFSLFAVGLGLALGAKIETRAQLSIWSWVIFLPIFLPTVFVLLRGLIPEGIIQVLRFAPGVALWTVLRYAFAQPAPLLAPLAWLGYLMLWAAGVMAIAVWMTRRASRQAEGRAAPKPAPLSTGLAGELQKTIPASGNIMAEAAITSVGTDIDLARPALLPLRESLAGAPRSRIQILWAIFAKDMREAVLNKLLLSLLIGSALIVLNGLFLPLLVELRERPSAVVYDEGRSTILREWSEQSQFAVRLTQSRQEFNDWISGGPGTWLGLILPSDFDQRANDPTGIELEGYVAHWANEAKVQRSKAAFEQQLALATGSEVHIDLAGHELYPAVDTGGQLSVNLVTIIIAIAAIGIGSVPLLIVEEKESHTLDALLVSPARFGEVVLAKALVGAVYCLLILGPILGFNARYIVHWEIALLAAGLCAAFVIAVGMLIGVLADNPTSTAVWALPMLLVVIVPMVAQIFSNPSWPAAVRALLPWTPGVVMVNLLRLSTAGHVPGSLLLGNLASLAGVAGVLYLLVGWRVRRLTR